MIKKISHNREEESYERKALWFQSLSLSERMDMLCTFTDFLLEMNPDIMEKKDVKSSSQCIRVLTRA